MLPRRVENLIRERLISYPAVVLAGPRQSGKTTLARQLAGRYFDLEQESDRVRLDVEWNDVSRADAPSRQPVVLDEVQSWPAVFPRLRGAIDSDPKRRGRFLLLGSIAPSLMRDVSESLAGRVSVVELTPFLAVELRGELDSLWLRGGYPDGGILDPPRFPQWQRDYLQLLIHRDLPNWGLTARPQVSERLASMLGALHGQLWNASQVGSGLGLSYHTVNSYVDWLEGAFLVRRLQPHFANLKKRLVKSSKVYWRDTGVLHAVLQTATRDELLGRPWVGQSWEGFVIEQVLGTLGAQGESVEASFLRTSDGREIDLVLRVRGEVWAIEVKLTTNPSIDELQRLDELAGWIGASRRVLISRVDVPSEDEARLSTSLEHFLARLEDGSLLPPR